jgi:hypothetical protein
MLRGPTDIAAQEEGIGVGVQGRTGVKGVMRDRAEADARMKQEQSRDACKRTNERASLCLLIVQHDSTLRTGPSA